MTFMYMKVDPLLKNIAILREILDKDFEYSYSELFTFMSSKQKLFNYVGISIDNENDKKYTKLIIKLCTPWDNFFENGVIITNKIIDDINSSNTKKLIEKLGNYFSWIIKI